MLLTTMRQTFLYTLLAIGCITQSCTSSSSAAAGETVAGNETIAALLQPNEEGIPYPIYEKYDDVAALLNQNDNKTYVINFWATWCGPCVAELPYFEQLAEETADDNVQLVMVSLDFQRDVRKKLKSFVLNRPLELPVIALADADYNSWIDRVDSRWGGAIPVTVIYRNGKREFHSEKFESYDELKAAVDQVR